MHLKWNPKCKKCATEEIEMTPTVYGYSTFEDDGSYGFLLMDKIRPVTKKTYLKQFIIPILSEF